MDTLDQRMQAAYDQIAPAFAQATQGSMPAALQALAQAILADLHTGTRLLDLGCGSGRDLAYFEQHGLQTMGLDRSRGMLAYARQQTSSPLIQARLQTLPIATTSVDAVWCCAALLHLPKAAMPLALEEIRRVLRPGGWIMISMQLGEGEQWNGGYVEGVQRFFARYQPEALDALIVAAGFTIIQTATDQTGQRSWYSLLCRKVVEAGA